MCGLHKFWYNLCSSRMSSHRKFLTLGSTNRSPVFHRQFHSLWWTLKLSVGSNSIDGRLSKHLSTDSHYASRFRSVAEPFSKIFSCVIKRKFSHWQERLRHVSVPFRRRCLARMFDVTDLVRTGLCLLDSDNVNSLTSPPLHFECLLATSAACFCLQKWMKN